RVWNDLPEAQRLFVTELTYVFIAQRTRRYLTEAANGELDQAPVFLPASTLNERPNYTQKTIEFANIMATVMDEFHRLDGTNRTKKEFDDFVHELTLQCLNLFRGGKHDRAAPFDPQKCGQRMMFQFSYTKEPGLWRLTCLPHEGVLRVCFEIDAHTHYHGFIDNVP